jgi:hypothetical protein
MIFILQMYYDEGVYRQWGFQAKNFDVASEYVFKHREEFPELFKEVYSNQKDEDGYLIPLGEIENLTHKQMLKILSEAQMDGDSSPGVSFEHLDIIET